MKERLSRRTLLRAGAATIALPLLDAMFPAITTAASSTKEPPKRIVLLHRALGTYHPHLVPTDAGKGYQATRYLKQLARHRENFTLFSGVSHLGYPNSHHTSSSIFTGVGAENVARSDDIHNTISLDQRVAAQVGGETRLRSLTLGSNGNSPSLSWNSKGVPVPTIKNRSRVFKKLFINGTPEETRKQLDQLAHGHSILDSMVDQLRSLRRELGTADQDRLQVMETSIREAEIVLHQEEAWALKPKPVVEATEKTFGDKTSNWLQSQQRWFALIRLALQTDSTRAIVYGLGEQNNNNVADLEIGHHDASHHGKDPAKIEQFARYEEKEYQNFAGFLDLLAETDEGGRSLLDSTQVLLTSNLGDASAHASNNLPTFLAGGGYKHQGHIAFDPKHNYPLSNLYVRMLQQFGIEADKFGSSTSILSELSS